MYPLIDLHCHLDLYDNPHKVASLCDASSYILSVTTTPKAWFGTKKLAENYKIKNIFWYLLLFTKSLDL